MAMHARSSYFIAPKLMAEARRTPTWQKPPTDAKELKDLQQRISIGAKSLVSILQINKYNGVDNQEAEEKLGVLMANQIACMPKEEQKKYLIDQIEKSKAQLKRSPKAAELAKSNCAHDTEQLQKWEKFQR